MLRENATNQRGSKALKSLGILAAAVIGLAGWSSHADAALIVTLNGATTITDNGAGDTDPASGQITNTTTVGGFGVAITVARSNSPGTNGAGVLEISSLDVRNNNAGSATLTVGVSDTGYTTPGGAAGTPMRLDSTFSGNFTQAGVGDSVTFKSFADPANGQPAATVTAPTLTATKANAALISEPFSGTGFIGWTRSAGAYSLANQTTITLSPNAQFQISGTTAATPEPTIVGLIAASLPLAMRRRRRA